MTIPNTDPTTQPNQPQASDQNQTPTNPTPSTNPAPTDNAAIKNTPATPAASLHARLFDGILKTLSGGPVHVMQTDPTSGATRRVEVPQSHSSMGKAIIAGVLSGMFAPGSTTSPGAGGAERNDPAKAIQIGGQVGMQAEQKKQDDAQKTQDSMQARKLMTVKNNIDLAHQMAALTHQQHVDLDDVISRNNDGVLKDAQTFDDNQTDPNQKIILARGLTMEEAMGKLKGNMTSQNAVVDGYVDVLDPKTGKSEPHPTYAILNPDLKVSMNEQSTKELAKFIPGYKGIYDLTGGNVRVPVRTYISDVNKANTLTMAESFFKRADEALGVKDNPDLAAAARKGGKPFMDAIMQAQSAMAAGGNTANVLDAVRKSPGAGLLFSAMGLDQDKVDKYINDTQNEKVRQEALAKEGGIGEKSPAPKEMVDGVLNAINQLPKEDQTSLLAGVNPKGMTVGEVEKLKDKALATVEHNKDLNERKLLSEGDPVQAAKTASNVIEGDVTNLSKAISYRGNARQTALNAIHDEAVARGLDSTQYSEQALESKSKMWDDYSENKKGTTGGLITSFNAFLGHESAAADAEKRLADKTIGLTGKPIVNVAIKDLAKQLTNNPDWKAYQTSLVPVRNEIQNFLAAGYATKSEDADLMHQILSDDETPARMTAALRQLADTADIRLQAIGQKYLDTMGTSYPNLLSADSKNTLKRFGIQSKSIPLAQHLPRGWAGGRAQEMTDKNMARAYFLAAGGDKEKTKDLAKTNGWTLN